MENSFTLPAMNEESKMPQLRATLPTSFAGILDGNLDIAFNGCIRNISVQDAKINDSHLELSVDANVACTSLDGDLKFNETIPEVRIEMRTVKIKVDKEIKIFGRTTRIQVDQDVQVPTEVRVTRSNPVSASLGSPQNVVFQVWKERKFQFPIYDGLKFKTIRENGTTLFLQLEENLASQRQMESMKTTVLAAFNESLPTAHLVNEDFLNTPFMDTANRVGLDKQKIKELLIRTAIQEQSAGLTAELTSLLNQTHVMMISQELSLQAGELLSLLRPMRQKIIGLARQTNPELPVTPAAPGTDPLLTTLTDRWVLEGTETTNFPELP
jgi:hypothetical protein